MIKVTVNQITSVYSETFEIPQNSFGGTIKHSISINLNHIFATCFIISVVFISPCLAIQPENIPETPTTISEYLVKKPCISFNSAYIPPVAYELAGLTVLAHGTSVGYLDGKGEKTNEDALAGKISLSPIMEGNYKGLNVLFKF